MENKIILKQTNHRGSSGLQVATLNVLFTKQGINKILNDIEKENMFKSVGMAYNTAHTRKEHINDKITNLFINFSDEIKQRLYDALKEPASIEAIFKAQKAYIRSGDEQKLQILLCLIKNYITEDDLEKILIDNCLDIITELTQNQINLLKFIKNKSINFNRSFKTFEEFKNNFCNRYLDIDFLNIKESDLRYLTYKQCLDTHPMITYHDDDNQYNIQNTVSTEQLIGNNPTLKSHIDLEKKLSLTSYHLTILSETLLKYIDDNI